MDFYTAEMYEEKFKEIATKFIQKLLGENCKNDEKSVYEQFVLYL